LKSLPQWQHVEHSNGIYNIPNMNEYLREENSDYVTTPSFGKQLKFFIVLLPAYVTPWTNDPSPHLEESQELIDYSPRLFARARLECFSEGRLLC